MFILKNKDSILWDPDLDLLAEILSVLDRQIESILSQTEDLAEADLFGGLDRAEHIAGLGFVACQGYMTSTYGFLNVKKESALSFGPCHKTGQRVVRIVDYAANYWKHYDEWHLDKSKARQDRIRNAFNDMCISVDNDYPLSTILSRLGDPEAPAFKPLVAMLASWRDELPRSNMSFDR